MDINAAAAAPATGGCLVKLSDEDIASFEASSSSSSSLDQPPPPVNPARVKPSKSVSFKDC